LEIWWRTPRKKVLQDLVLRIRMMTFKRVISRELLEVERDLSTDKAELEEEKKYRSKVQEERLLGEMLINLQSKKYIKEMKAMATKMTCSPTTIPKFQRKKAEDKDTKAEEKTQEYHQEPKEEKKEEPRKEGQREKRRKKKLGEAAEEEKKRC